MGFKNTNDIVSDRPKTNKKTWIIIFLLCVCIVIGVLIWFTIERKNKEENEYSSKVNEYNVQVEIIQNYLTAAQTYGYLNNNEKDVISNKIGKEVFSISKYYYNTDHTVEETLELSSKTDLLKEQYYTLCSIILDKAVNDYNILVEQYENNSFIYTTDSNIIPQNISKKNTTDYVIDKENAQHNITILEELSSESRKLGDFNELANKIIALCSDHHEIIHEYNDQIETINSFIKAAYNHGYLEKIEKLIPKEEISDEIISERVFLSNDYEGVEAKINELESDIDVLQEQYSNLYNAVFETAIAKYNTLAKAYNDIVKKSSVDFIDKMPNTVDEKRISDYVDTENVFNSAVKMLGDLTKETDDLAANYTIVDQITAPEESWVLSRLAKIDTIKEKASVNQKNDPNKLLGKTGGYKACIYFADYRIDQKSIDGISTIEKGTDCGGSIEIYNNLEDAKKRCEYLSQFDNSLLYTGSYAILGTMVIRTSYKFTEKQQIEVTDKIVNALTEISSNSSTKQ